MPANNIGSLTPTQLLALANRAHTAIGSSSPNAYGVPGSQLSNMIGWATDLTNANVAVDNAKAAYHAAVQTRELCKTGCADLLGAVARTIYANPDVTPTMIAAAGFQPRSTSKARIVPKTPTEPTATVQSNGDVLLKWNRATNPQGVVFLVESRTGTGPWLFAQETTAARLVLAGYAAGDPTSFRITASKNGMQSTPSPIASVYPSESIPALRLAA